jgi:stage V sporulation protein G
MQIIGMRNVDWNKVKAILTIKTQDGFEIKNCKLVEGTNGLFVASPSVKKKDDGYMDIIWFPKDKRDQLNDMASEIYDPSGEYRQFNNQQGKKLVDILDNRASNSSNQDEGVPF